MCELQVSNSLIETVLALGMTSSRHSQDLLNIWLSGLEQDNPSLGQARILFATNFGDQLVETLQNLTTSE